MSSLIRSPLPSLISDAHFYISGNVTVHPSAVIAPGVLLQADPGSELIVAAGVCIGAGSVLHAHQGRLEIETGATLGSTVLIVGQGNVGTNACVGSMTTIFNSSVLPQQIVPPGSLLGDGSRQVIVVESTEAEPTATKSTETKAAETQSAQTQSAEVGPSKASATQPTPTPSPPAAAQPPESAVASSAGEVQVVYGRAYLERMMLTMFPHRQSTHQSSQENKDEG